MKKILITFLVVVLTIIIGGVTYLFTFDVNSYKGQIERVLLEKTGFPVSIKGQMQVTKSLNPTLIVHDIEIKNATGFADVPFVKVQKAQMSFDLVAFFKNIINVQNIELSDVSMQLMVNRKGQDNWSRIAQKTKTSDDKKSAKPSLSKAAAVSTVAQTQIDLITINNLDVSYQDDLNQVKDSISFPSLTLKGLVNIDGFAVYNKEKFAFSGSVKNLISVITTFRNLNFSFDVKALDATAKISGVCRDVSKCANDVTLNLTAKGKNLKKAYAFWGKNTKFVPEHAFEMSAAVRTLKKQLVAEGTLDLTADGIELSYNVEHDLSKKTGSGRIELNVVKPDFIQQYGLNPFTLQTAYVLKAEGQINFDNIAAMFDETDLDGSIALAEQNGKLTVVGDLHSHYFKLSNVFFEKVQSTPTKSAEDAAKSLFSTKTFNLGWMDKLNMNLGLTIDNWYAGNLFARYPVVSVDVQLKDSKMTANLLEGSSFAGGLVVGKLDLDKTTSEPKWNFELVAENLHFNQVNALKKQLRSGNMDVNLFLTAKGNSQNAVLTSLNGKALFLTNQVEILSPIVTELFSPTAQGGSAYRTHQDLFIKCGVINASIQDGDIILDKKAALETSRFNMLVGGDINLNKETIDLRFIPQKTAQRAGEVSQAISAVSLTGPLDNPKPGVEADVSSLLTDVLPKIMQKSVEKKSVLDVYRKKAVEDFSVCRVAADGMEMKTIDLYMGRLPKAEQTEVVEEEQPVEEKPTKAQKLGKELLDSFSDVLAGATVEEQEPATTDTVNTPAK